MSQYEYKIVQLELNETQLLMSRSNPQALIDLNKIVEEELNKWGKDGWLLGPPGINSVPTLIFYREKLNKKGHNKKRA